MREKVLRKWMMDWLVMWRDVNGGGVEMGVEIGMERERIIGLKGK